MEVTEPVKHCINRGYEACKIVLIKELDKAPLFLEQKMKWINVNEQYLDYLRAAESRIPRTDYGENKYKPFFGILFETNELYYITQVSHAQPRHTNLKQQKDFYKIFDPKNPSRLIAVINLNYMFPIPKSEVFPFEKNKIHTYRTFASEQEKSKYIDLLDTELSVIILTTDEICREYRASRRHEVAYFLMRLCASYYTERSVFLTASIILWTLKQKRKVCMI